MADLEGPQHGEALKELVEERYQLMVRFAARQLDNLGVPQSAADPQDLVQNALCSVLKRTEPITFLRRYTYTCIRHEALRAAERYETGRGYESLDADVRAEDEPAASCFEEGAEQRLVINEALADLPLQQRRAFFLTRELGMTQAQAAEVMRTATPTVGVHASRAIKTLRVALVTLGTSLVVWVTGQLATGARQIIPGSGREADPVQYAATVSLVLLVGLSAGALGLLPYLPEIRYGSRALWRALKTEPEPPHIDFGVGGAAPGVGKSHYIPSFEREADPGSGRFPDDPSGS
ncbi:sigma-70 family RNA polymerase sigma factor [Streptomyces massasporeus]|uniref:sigma-70 family RNA polymerase sigma factor n=1 Tax=Streptomyces massasporeus TaxID=67324 RepID=UPI0036E13F5C